MPNEVIEELGYLIKEVEDIFIHGEFANTSHHVEVGEKSGVFFVRLDGALLEATQDPVRAFAIFYDQISKIHDDEEKGTDPGFATLREILISRSKYIEDSLEKLGKGTLGKALMLLEFNEESTQDSIFKDIQANLRILEAVSYRPAEKEGIECHTCIFFADGGFCPKIGMPVKEEYVCDLYQPMPGAEAAEKFAEISQQPYEVAENRLEKAHEGTDGMQYLEKPAAGADGFVEETLPSLETTPSGEKPLSGPGEEVTGEPKTNNVTHGSSMADGDIYKAADVSLSTKAIILDSDGRLLILKDSSSDWWDLPGGHIKNDETVEDGLRREVFEEAGLLITSCKQLFTKNLALGNPPVDRPVIFFIASAMGDIRLSVEHTDFTWADTRVLDSYNLGVFLPVIREALEEESSKIPVIESHGFDLHGKAYEMGGHEMEVTDMGMPYYDDTQEKLTKHHEPSGYDMGEPNAEADNSQTQRHEYPESMPPREGEKLTSWAGLTHEPKRAHVQKGVDKNQEPLDGTPAGENVLKLAGLTGEKISPAPERLMERIPDHKVPYTPDVPSEIRIKMSENGMEVAIPVMKNAYSEAGGPAEREKPYIEADHDASTSSDARSIGVFGSGAVIDLPDDMAEEKGVIKDAVGGVGHAGEGGATGSEGGGKGSVGPLTTGDTFIPTYGKREQHSDFDSGLAQKQHDTDVIGTNEGIATLPTVDAYEQQGGKRYNVTRHDYEEDIREKNAPRSPILPPEQKPLGEGEMNIWLQESETSPNTRLIVEEGMDGKAHPGLFDESREQYTNLSAETLMPFLKKSGDSIDTLLERFSILSSDSAIRKASKGIPLVVAGWGSYYVVDREGHRLSLKGLKTALARFLSSPEYANMNIFHSGIQVGKVLAEFVDEYGKIWKTEVTDEGLFAVCEFRTDLEVARRAMAEVLKGTLRGFSIAGNSNPETKQIICEHGVCWEEVMDLEIYEITLCQMPMNQKSWITDIIQRPDSFTCPECYEIPVAGGFDSALRTR